MAERRPLSHLRHSGLLRTVLHLSTTTNPDAHGTSLQLASTTAPTLGEIAATTLTSLTEFEHGRKLTHELKPPRAG
jgi:hypothetical protein